MKIGLLGFGTVGAGVYDILAKHQEKINQMTGTTLTVKKILVSNVAKHQEAIEAGLPITDQFDAIIQDEEIEIVVEVMGSVETAKKYIVASLEAGKNVVTANKDLLALYGAELMALAEEKGKDLLFEASVAGGIPILRTLAESYAGDYIREVLGIVNGTTNFMLTQMQEESKTYAEALALAQEKGFAESDPSGDVEGMDAARKMVILTKLAFGHRISLDEMAITGITSITPVDFQVAAENGYTIKLIGKAHAIEGKIQVEVSPMFIPLSHPLATVKNEYNAVFVVGEAVGETMFYGPGAGKMPTANSVISDLIYITKNIRSNHTGHFNLYATDVYKNKDKDSLFVNGILRCQGSLADAHRLLENGLTGRVLYMDSADNRFYLQVEQVPVAKLAALNADQLELVFKMI